MGPAEALEGVCVPFLRRILGGRARRGIVALLMLSTLMRCALHANAASGVIAWGDPAVDPGTIVPAGVSNVVAVAGGTWSSLALKDDGTVAFWGSPIFGTGPTNFPPGLTNISAIALGHDFGMALRGDGHVLAWGNANYDYGQLSVPADLTNASAIAGGGGFGLALRSNGTVTAWGTISNVPPNLTNVIAIAAGDSHVVSLKADGTVVAWLSDLSTSNASTIIPADLSNVVAIAARATFSLALKADGTVTGWGPNFYGELTIPSGLSNVTKIACGGFSSMALKSDGTVMCWGAGGSGSNSWPNFRQSVVPFGLTNVTAISGGYQHSLAINDGSPALITLPASQTNYSGVTITFNVTPGGLAPLTYQWQFNGVNITDATNVSLVFNNVQLAHSGNYRLIVSNPYGSVTSPDAYLAVSNSLPLILQQPVSLARLITSNCTFSVNATGSIPISCQWRFNGDNIPGATSTSVSLTNVQLSASGTYDCVLANAYGSITSSPAILTVTPTYVVGWGIGGGVTNHPVSLSHVVAISAGSGSLALQSNGLVFDWGPGPFPTNGPPGLSNVIAIDAGEGLNVALTADGSVTAWGVNFFSATNVPAGISNVVAVAAGAYHGMALRRDGTVVGWGNWVSDRVNFGPFIVPPTATNIIAISTGLDHALALRRNGTVLAWGGLPFGSLSTNVPVGLNGVVAIASGDQHCLALKSNGTVVTWGATFIPTGLSNVVAIAAGEAHSVALKADGTVAAWGDNSYGQVTVPLGLSNVVAIAAGSQFTLALRDLRAPALHPVKPAKSNNVFTASSPTLNNHAYSLESKDSLTQNNWRFVGLVAGIGDVVSMSDPGASVSQRFYRVRQW